MAESSVRKRGQPTLYAPEYCEQLIEHMKAGRSFESFGAIVNCCKDTLYEWCKVHQDFSDAKRLGTQHSRLFWENLGIDHVLNKSESSKHPDGTLNSKATSLNSAVWIFNMKNRFKDEWREKQEVETSGSAEIKIVIDKDDAGL